MNDSTRFVTTPGSDGFVVAQIQKRMKGDSFVWTRSGVSPAAGSRFEIRPKPQSATSLLNPPIPVGVDEIRAQVNRSTAEHGAVYAYSLWQVLADGREREIHDPELQIEM
jgi:hypothetical protein